MAIAYGTGFRLDGQGEYTILRSLADSYPLDQFDGGKPLGSLLVLPG